MTPWPLPAAFPLTLAGCVLAILAFVVISARIALRNPSLKYGRLWPVQFGCYFVFGVVAMFVLFDARLAGLIGAITGFVEATLGWAITWRMGPGRQAEATPTAIAVAVVSMVAFGFGLALVGAIALSALVWLVARYHG